MNQEAIASEAARRDVYFVPVSRFLAEQMKEFGDVVRVRFEKDPLREGEGQFIVKKLNLSHTELQRADLSDGGPKPGPWGWEVTC